MHHLQVSVGMLITILMLLTGSGLEAYSQGADATPSPDVEAGAEIIPGSGDDEKAPEDPDASDPEVSHPAESADADPSDPAELPPLQDGEGESSEPEGTGETPEDPVDTAYPPTGPPTSDSPDAIQEAVTDPASEEDVPPAETPASTGAGETSTDPPALPAADLPVGEISGASGDDTLSASRTSSSVSDDEETLTVTVLDPGGKPLPNAYVTVRNDDWMLSGEGITNDDGVVVLRDLGGGRAYRVQAYALDSLRGGGEIFRDDNMDLALTIHMFEEDQPRDSVKIEALDFQTGLFIRGAAYRVYDASGTLVRTVQAGANDVSVEVAGLDPGYYSVVVNADGFAPGYGQFFVPQAYEATVLMMERATFAFSLMVVDAANGNPVGGAHVTISAGNGDVIASGETDANGMLSRNLLDRGNVYEQYGVSVTHPHFLAGSTSFTHARPSPVSLQLGLDSLPRTSVALTVVDEGGDGVGGASVTVVRDHDSETISGQTDGEGRFEAEGLIDGAYTVIVTKDGFRKSEVYMTVPDQASVEIRLYRTSPDDGPELTFLYLDAQTKRPLQGVHIRIVSTPQAETALHEGYTRSDGTFTTTAYRFGVWIESSAIGYSAIAYAFPSLDGVIQVRPIELHQVLQGIVVDDVTGAPLSSATMRASRVGSPGIARTITHQNGWFQFAFHHGIPIELSVEMPGYETRTVVVTMRPGELVEIRLSPVSEDTEPPDEATDQGTLTTDFTLCANEDCVEPHDTSMDGSIVTWTVTGQDDTALMRPDTIALASTGIGGTGVSLRPQATGQYTINAVLEGGIAHGSIDLPVGGYVVCLEPALTGADGVQIPLASEAACDTVRLSPDGVIGGPLAFMAAVDDDVNDTAPDPADQGEDDTPDQPTTGEDAPDAAPVPRSDDEPVDSEPVATVRSQVTALPSTGTGPQGEIGSPWWLIPAASVLLVGALGLRNRWRA